jgi:hypothetical protein
MEIMEGFTLYILQKEIKRDWGEQIALSDSDCGLEVVSNLFVEEDCAI